MSKVYIVHKSHHDYSAAEQFGEFNFLTEELINRFDVNEMQRQITEGLHESNPDDYILISGMAIMASIAIAIFAFKHGKANLLLWQGDKQQYIKRTIIL